MISLTSALAGCGGLAVLFVGSLYLAPKHVRQRQHWDPVQIQWRFGSSLLVCMVSPLIVYQLMGRPPMIMNYIGLRGDGLVQALTIPTSLITGLFAGPLATFMYSYERSGGRFTSLDRFLSDFFPNYPNGKLEKIRNIIVAPFAEELVFRCCMGSLLFAAGVSRNKIILFSPLFFGAAHLHHCYGMIKYNKVAPKIAILTSIAQMTYTTLFGGLEMFFFLRTGHFMSVFLIHGFCNLAGLPSVGFLNPDNENYPHRAIIGLSYICGICFFIAGLFPLTDPTIYRNTLYWN